MTKKAADPTTKSPNGDNQFSLGTLASDLLSTTWRMTVPVVIFVAAGIFIDVKAHTKPWATLAGSLIGFVCAGLLLKQLLTAVEREEEKK